METILKRLREQHNYSVKESSVYFNDDENLIKAWELGVAEPTISQCLILSGLYGVSVDEMFTGYDIRTAVPLKQREKFEYEAMLNRMANRWYN